MRLIKFLFLYLFSIYGISYSQTEGKGIVSGYIYDISSGEALISANVYIKELKRGAGSNLGGYFVISDIPKGEHVLSFSMVGYKTKMVKIRSYEGDNRLLKIYLESDAIKQKEVVVTAGPSREIEKLFEKPISKVELTPAQISKIPQVVESDLLRSLQTLPGVVSVSDFSSALFIRGGTPDQNLYLIDGTDVYNPEHAFGLFSTFNTDAIKKVDLSKGGFGAEYGGRLSSVLDITNLDGNRNHFEGTMGISLLSAKSTFQSPLGNFGSISGSIRRTYFDQTVAKWVDEVPNYYFYDGNLKAFFDIDDNNKLTASFYGGQDKLNYIFDKDKEDSPSFDYKWGNTTGSINWKRLLGKKFFGNFWITASKFSSNFSFGDEGFAEDNLLSDLTFKGNIEYYSADNLDFKFGFEQKNLHAVYKVEFPSGGKVDINKNRTLYVAYLTSTWKPTVLWDIEAGLRYNYFISDKNFHNLDPRLSLKYRLSESSNLKFAAGIYHQYLDRVERGFLTGVWASADKYINVSASNHFILGLQKELFKDYQLEIEAFYKDYKNIYSYNYLLGVEVTPDSYNLQGQPVFTETRGVFNRGDGNSKGVELLLKKDAGAITGWIGYSLARTEYTIDGINQGRAYVPRHDRTSVVNALMNIDINDFFDELNNIENQEHSSNWSIGFNFVYTTGQPITVPGSVYSINSLPNGGGSGLFIYPTDIDTYRLPYYARIDLSITYHKSFESWSMSPYLQIYNIGNRRNIFFIQYQHETINNAIVQNIDTFPMMPILPSIGINIKF